MQKDQVPTPQPDPNPQPQPQPDPAPQPEPEVPNKPVPGAETPNNNVNGQAVAPQATDQASGAVVAPQSQVQAGNVTDKPVASSLSATTNKEVSKTNSQASATDGKKVLPHTGENVNLSVVSLGGLMLAGVLAMKLRKPRYVGRHSKKK